MARATDSHTRNRIKITVGQRFGRLTAVAQLERLKGERERWNLKCDCGSEAITRKSSLIAGFTTSCGCFQSEQAAARQITHGMRKSSEYTIWVLMRARCENPKEKGFPKYGGRGIKVCERWDKFETFYEDMGPRPSPEHSIDRRNNDGNYEPDNCRWATHQEQARNRRNTRFVTLNGKTITLAEATHAAGLSQSIVWKRLDRGWTIERALNLEHSQDISKSA